MRILVVSQYFWPENFRVNDLVAEMVSRGHEVTVLTGEPNYPAGEIFPEYRDSPGHFGKYEGADIVRVPLLPRRQGAINLLLNYLSFTLSASLIGPWRLRKQAFDVVFVVQLSPVTVGLPAALLAKIKRVPLILWVLDLWPETLQAIGVVKSPSLLGWVGRLVAFIYGRCDLLLAQSESFILQMRKYAGANKRIEYFPSWSDSVFDFSTVELAPEIPVVEGVFSIVFAGNIGDAQDFPAILEAASILRDSPVRWLIVGDGRAAGWVAEQIVVKGLQDKVLMVGRYPLERMPSFYKHADALLVSLKDEPIFAMTIPGKLQSYLASGVPVLAMLNGEGAEIVRKTGSGLACNAGDSVGLADAVMKMMAMGADDLKQMGGNGLLATETHFDRMALISRLLGWFGDLRKTV